MAITKAGLPMATPQLQHGIAGRRVLLQRVLAGICLALLLAQGFASWPIGRSDDAGPMMTSSSLSVDVKAADAAYRAAFPLPADDESPVEPLPSKLYDDRIRCLKRRYAVVFRTGDAQEAAPWNGLWCVSPRSAAKSRGFRFNASVQAALAFGVGPDRWTHPSLVRAAQDDAQPTDADTVVLFRDDVSVLRDDDAGNATALPQAAAASATAAPPHLFFTRNPLDTKVIRNVLYFRHVKRSHDFFAGDEQAEQPPPPPAPAPRDRPDLPTIADIRRDDDEAFEIQQADATDTSSVLDKIDPLTAPNDVAEKFVVASPDAYHDDKALYRRLTESEAQRAVKFHAKLRAWRQRKRANATFLASAEASDADDDEAHAEHQLASASHDHLALQKSNFVGHRATLGFFSSAAAVAARPPDIVTLGDGFSAADVSIVDVIKFNTLAARVTPLPPQLRHASGGGAPVAVGKQDSVNTTRRVPLAFVINLRTCLANHWHGTAEVALPLFMMLLRHKVITDDVAKGRAELPLIFVRAPPRNVWGPYNRGCPSLNAFPYGHTTDGAWLFRLFAPNVVFFDERGEHRRHLEGRPVQNASLAITINRLVVSGLDYTCGGAFDVMTFYAVETNWSPRRLHPGAAYPFVVAQPHACDGFLPVVRRFVTTRFDVPDRGWLTPDDVRCPRVAILDRQGSRNGRNMVSWVEFFTAMSQFVQSHRNANGCPPLKGAVAVLRLHRSTPAAQIAALQNVTVLVAIRGAATVAAAFVRPGTAVISLTPVHMALPLSFRSDNVPWWPFYTMRKDVVAVLGRCRAVPHSDPKSKFADMCRQRSVNFCDMDCDAGHAEDLLTAALAAQQELALEAALLHQRAKSVDDEEKLRETALAFATLLDGEVRVAPLSLAVAFVGAKRPLWTLPAIADMASPPDANSLLREPFLQPLEFASLAPLGNKTVETVGQRRDWYFKSHRRRSMRNDDADFDTTAQHFPTSLVTVIVPDVMHAPGVDPFIDRRIYFASIKSPHRPQ